MKLVRRSIQYQWQKAAPNSVDFQDITGAKSASYTTPNLVVSDDGSQFLCKLTSGTAKTSSGAATLNVDGTIPSLEGATAGINLNALYIRFSEAMNLEQLAVVDNYSFNNGLSIVAAIALDSTSVKLVTSTQVSGAPYSVVINNVSDVAGNKVPTNSKADFVSVSVVKGVAGLEIWKNLGGGAVNDLKNNARYLEGSDVDYVTTTFDSTLTIPDNTENTYGGRFRAWITPEVTGEYEFFLSADDTGELRISLDGSFDNIDSVDNTPIAVDSTLAPGFQETGVDGSTSAFIPLEAGVSYAIQAIWKETNGTDFCKVAWRLAGDPTPAAELLTLPSAVLSYYGLGGTTANVRRISLTAGKASIEWAGARLEVSDDLLAWTPIAAAANPYVVNATGRKFYRAK